MHLAELWRWHKRHHRHRITAIRIFAFPFGDDAMTLTLNDAQKTTLSAVPVDAAGAPVPMPTGTTVSYVADNAAALVVTANGDGVTASAAGATPGAGTITATMTVPAVAPATTPTVFTATLAFTVISSAIAGFTIAFTPPA
jgi:hypothetical protein